MASEILSVCVCCITTGGGVVRCAVEGRGLGRMPDRDLRFLEGRKAGQDDEEMIDGPF